ncbi:MAG: hypothetical protein ACLRTQ_10680 [Candidatus Borkfalkia sp.]
MDLHPTASARNSANWLGVRRRGGHGLIMKENVITTFTCSYPPWRGASGLGRWRKRHGAVMAEESTGVTWQADRKLAFNMLTIPLRGGGGRRRNAQGQIQKYGRILDDYVLFTATIVYIVPSWWWTAFILAAPIALAGFFVFRNKGMTAKTKHAMNNGVL